MFCVKSGLVIVCLFVVGVDSYWYQYLGSGPFFNKNWKPHRRSLTCAETDEQCGHTTQCCDPKNVCLKDREQSVLIGRDIGICKNIEKLKPDPEFLKPLGAKCSDSTECGAGLCCRGIFRFRYGKVYRCEKSDSPFMCISNDAFEY
ncbi:uncharacterized protein LOC133190103 [Saccostrea echinata]|uniref:uncharacterized protein LOC133190103 n=1 Tax=Saccostrea echinata TaxID=191078 RepID=UPI002A82782C|nr:uncharacterized protein LOC133190103 [Saccostrea echinata]